MKKNIIVIAISGVVLTASLLWMASCAAPAPAVEPTPISDGTIIRGPYLQSVMPDSIIIVWETEGSTSGEIVYGETDEYGSSVTDPEVGTNHAVTLTNLAPYSLITTGLRKTAFP